MSQWQIRYTKEDVAKADAKGMHLAAVGYYGAGRGEAIMFMPAETATFLWLFAHNLNRKMAPVDAFAEAEKAIAENKAKREQAAAASAPA